MKVFKFSNLVGTVYTKGNILFSPDGFTLMSPVGNKVTLYDLKKHSSNTLSIDASHNYTSIALSPNGLVLIAGNEIGEIHVISLVSKTKIHQLNTKGAVSNIKFSPDGRLFAFSRDNQVFLYNSPTGELRFNGFEMKAVFHDMSADVLCMDWSYDSRFLAVGSVDTMIRIYAIAKYSNFKLRHASVSGHTAEIIGNFFEDSSYDMYSISRNGQICVWECMLPEEVLLESPKEYSAYEFEVSQKEQLNKEDVKEKQVMFKKVARYYFTELFKNKPFRPSVSCADFSRKSQFLVTGFEDGLFAVHKMPEFEQIHCLSVSEHRISTVTMNSTSEWISFGCPNLGQLLVWEWKSDTYVMKQQGHFNTMNAFDYSQDGSVMATGGQDGKVKLWNTMSSFCFVTFEEHTASVTGVVFTQNGRAVLSSSLDGTVRAFDLTRYRNFRTFTSTRPVQFSCVSCDSSKEFVAAGGQDVFEIYMWSMKTGLLLEVLKGHEGPVAQIAFSPTLGATALASVSWDKTLRFFESIETSGESESVSLPAEATCLAFRPDGKEVAVGTLDSQLTFVSVLDCSIVGSIEGRHHLGSGRSDMDLITAKKSLEGKAFSTLAYSPDGKNILAGGPSKHICMYDSFRQVLVEKFTITKNESFDAVNEFVNHRKMTEFGNMDLVEDRDREGSEKDRLSMPGTKKGDMASRAYRPEIKVSCIRFSPTGRVWGATTTEGLILYSCDNQYTFDPIKADIQVTPQRVKAEIKLGKYDLALMLALRLNSDKYIREVVEQVPQQGILAVCQSLDLEYSHLLLSFLSEELGHTRHIHFLVNWVNNLLRTHLIPFKSQLETIRPAVHNLEKNLKQKLTDLKNMSKENVSDLDYLKSMKIQSVEKENGDASASSEDELISYENPPKKMKT